MKTNELRIGNWVKTNYEGILETININSEGFEYIDCRKPTFKAIGRYPIDSIEPIHITEEWLLKFGFETSAWDNHSTYRKMIGNNDYTIVFDEYSNTMIGDIMIKEIKYVHQLQNLYFALTGEELSVKTDLAS